MTTLQVPACACMKQPPVVLTLRDKQQRRPGCMTSHALPNKNINRILEQQEVIRKTNLNAKLSARYL